MPSEYRTPRPECRTLARSLSAVADALSDHVADLGVRAVGESIGLGKSTVQDWKDDISEWKAVPLLTLARTTPTIRTAVLSYLEDRKQPSPEATAAVRDAFESARACSALIDEILADVADGRFSPEEFERIQTRVAAVQAKLPVFLNNLAAAAVRSR